MPTSENKNAMTSREIVKAMIEFRNPPRLPGNFPEPFENDIIWTGISPDPDPLANLDLSQKSWDDAWGCHWERLGNTQLGEVKNHVLDSWEKMDSLQYPDVVSDYCYAPVKKARADYPDKYLIASGISLYFRIQFLRGVTETWTDIYDYPEELGQLIDQLVDLDEILIRHYAEIGVDGFNIGDDWGLQNTLQISPQKWREIWKPRYQRLFTACKKRGLHTILHSCGYIVDILDDLIECGLDVIHMDQQENMGLYVLSERFGGRITFFSPVDIQKTMISGSLEDIRAYCRKMKKSFYKNGGGFIPRWYTDPDGVGHTRERIDVMCTEFLKIRDLST